MQKGIAVFDFDGTISRKDSLIDFVIFARGKANLGIFILKNLPYIGLFYLGILSAQKFKERFFSYFFSGYSKNKLEEIGASYCINRIEQIIYHDAQKVIEWHRCRNHHIYLLTASSGIWLNHWCEKNQIKCIGTHFEIENGVFNGRISGKNCKGKEKVKRLLEQADLNDFEESYGYANSKSDRFFLRLLKNTCSFSLNKKHVAKISWLKK